MNKKNKLIDFFFRINMFLMFFLPFCWVVYNYGPNLVFYFDQTTGVAKMKSIGEKRVDFTYYHAHLMKDIKLVKRIGNLKKTKKLKSKKEWDIVYSKFFPNLVSIVGIDPKPGPGIVIFMLFFFLPLFFTHKFSDE